MAELASHLTLWLQSPAADQEDFELDSIQAEPGPIPIVSSDEGRWVGSIVTPDVWTSLVAWDVLVAEIKQFDRSVREGVAAMGIELVSPQSPDGCSGRVDRAG
ncbi:hypothetical protein [Streptomyces sp. NBC_00996]|uniref:hypothetical protein n=1 Tax=Streptomyces sp. NBC_00996 TaxID=2903710 RepID=UPI00386F750E|nr:hypothetical protein OG390_49445 [Streptomyces sp. NBC_00996]